MMPEIRIEQMVRLKTEKHKKKKNPIVQRLKPKTWFDKSTWRRVSEAVFTEANFIELTCMT